VSWTGEPGESCASRSWLATAYSCTSGVELTGGSARTDAAELAGPTPFAVVSFERGGSDVVPRFIGGHHSSVYVPSGRLVVVEPVVRARRCTGPAGAACSGSCPARKASCRDCWGEARTRSTPLGSIRHLSCAVLQSQETDGRSEASDVQGGGGAIGGVSYTLATMSMTGDAGSLAWWSFRREDLHRRHGGHRVIVERPRALLCAADSDTCRGSSPRNARGPAGDHMTPPTGGAGRASRSSRPVARASNRSDGPRRGRW